MEELQPEDLKDLLQELEEEAHVEEELPPEVGMKARICPKCDKHNSEHAFHCINCGTTLSIKTILDMETGKMNVTPIAGETELSSISMEFEQHVAETLISVKQSEEDVIWGSNITDGFLILTSQRLICVHLVTPVDEMKGCVKELVSEILWPLALIPIAFRSLRYAFTGHPDVSIPRESSFQADGLERQVTVDGLKDLVSITPERRWDGDDHFTSIGLNYSQGAKMKLTFMHEQDAHKASKLLEAYISTGRFY